MPQLEIHHADGNVTYAELTQDKPLMVGSASNCDVVLSDPAVKRVHCRLLWRPDRSEWRVEVAADAGGVQLGGKAVKAGTIRAGDVIGVANCRIYVDDAAGKKSMSESDALMARVYDTPEPAALQEVEPEPTYLGRGSIRKASHMRDPRNFLQKTWSAFLRLAKEQLRGEVDRAPGEERIIGSPLVRWLLVGLVVVGALAWYFYTDFREKTIQAHFDKAQSEMGKENWEGAIHLFTSFIELHPTHELASNARVQKALCDVQTSGSSVAAMEAVRKMIRERAQEKAFDQTIPKIGEVVARLAQSLAENARDRADAKALERSQEALEIIKRDLPGTELSSETEAKLQETMEQARMAIHKYEDFLATREAMDRAIASAATAEAYRARERLVQLYGDYASHPDLTDRMNQAHKLDTESVRWEPMNKAAETQPRAGPIVASTVLLVRTQSGDSPSANGNIQFALAGGAVSAHDGNTGQMLWSLPIGHDSRLLPMPLQVTGSSDPAVLVIDSHRDELMAVQAMTGKMLWRQSVGEPIDAAPLLFRGKLYQPTGQGSLLVVDPNTGRVDGRLRFADQRFSTTPAVHEASRHLFLNGEHYLLYNIALGGVPKCESVYYTAHRPDSIFAAPLRLNRYLVLFENQTASTMLIRVFLLSQDGKSIEEIQNLPKKGDTPISGWVHYVPAVYGNLMFVATDLESVYVYSGGAPEKADGFTLVKSLVGGTPLPGTRPQAYSMSYTDKDLLVQGSRVRRYTYAAEQQALNPAEELLVGAASQPIQRFPTTGGRIDLLYVGRRTTGSSAIAFTALDSQNLQTKWEVLLGTGVISLQPADDAKTNWLALTRTGHLFSIPTATLTSGAMLDKPLARIDMEGELSDSEPVILPDGSAVFTPAGATSRLYVRGAASDSAVRPLDLLAPLQSTVLGYGEGILAPGSDGRIYYMSPGSGKPLSEPFHPPLVADQPAEWRGVALTSNKTIVAVDDQGNIYQVDLKKQPSPELVERAGTKLPKPIRSGIAVSGNLVACVDEANVVHVWDAEALSPIAEIKLSGPASLGPVAAGGYLLVAAGDDELVCVDPQGQEAWRRPLDGQHISGRPLVTGDLLHFVTSSGMVHSLRVADGSEVWSADTEKSLSGGPINIGENLVAIGADGSLNVVKPPLVAN
jgi:outer membrane protein assembly factor BamB